MFRHRFVTVHLRLSDVRLLARSIGRAKGDGEGSLSRVQVRVRIPASALPLGLRHTLRKARFPVKFGSAFTPRREGFALRPRAPRGTCAGRRGNSPGAGTFRFRTVRLYSRWKEPGMGKGILLWLLGIPLPIIIILLLIWH
jgi:hypothetical protein